MKALNAVFLGLMVLALVPGWVCAADPEFDPFYAKQVNVEKGPIIDEFVEEVDPFSGSLRLVYTDFVLPGNGGLDLKIVRYYDSSIYGNYQGVVAPPGLTAQRRKSPLGMGWYMHMGILRNPFGNNPVFEMPDGARKTFYLDASNANQKISQDLWILKMTSGVAPFAWEIIASDGTVYTVQLDGGVAGYYEDVSASPVAQVTKIQNPGRTSTITVAYTIVTDPYLTPYSYISSISDSTGRTVTFSYNQSLHQLTSISVNGRTMNYYYNRPSYNGMVFNTLSQVKPPLGNSWYFTYDAANLELNKITYPAGGVISYVYTPLDFPTGSSLIKLLAITQRSISGRDIPTGTWNYQYAPGGNSPTGNGAVTTILAPNGMKEVQNLL